MTVYVREYADIAVTHSKHVPAGAEPALLDQTVANAAGSVALTTPFSVNTKLVMVHTDSIISIIFSEDDATNPPSAAITNMRMAANDTLFFGVRPGGSLAVIDNT